MELGRFLLRNPSMQDKLLYLYMYSNQSAKVLLTDINDEASQFGLASFSSPYFNPLVQLFKEIGYSYSMPIGYSVSDKNIENEVKLEVPSESRFGKLRKSLESLGKLHEVVSERNYFIDRNNEFKDGGKLLRLRRKAIINPEEKNITRLTYKGPQESSEFKKRLEINANVDNFEMASQFFKVLGYNVKEMYWKHRTVYDLDGVHVFLDRANKFSLDIPTSYHWRKFVEIEGTDGDIKSVISKLKIEDLEQKESYGEILFNSSSIEVC